MAKRNFILDHKKQQALPMSSSHTHIVDAATRASQDFLQDDDDDICPVCESECTCHNRQNSVNSSVVATPSTTSTSSSNPIPTASPLTRPLKIKLTLPPHLKLRRSGAILPSLCPEPGPSATPPVSETTIITNARPDLHAQTLLDSTAPKRRGRPSKAVVAAREAAKAALAVAHAATVGAGDIGSFRPDLPSVQPFSHRRDAYSTITTRQRVKDTVKPASTSQIKGKQVRGRPVSSSVPVKTPRTVYISESPLTVTDDSDADDTSLSFPTFISAGSTASHSSSSESNSDSTASATSDSEHDEYESLHGNHAKRLKRKVRREQSGDDGKRRELDHSTKWEIRTRMRSVGPEGGEADVDSGELTSDEGGADDEEDEEDEDADADADADIEGEGLAEVDEDDELPSADGKLGVSFDGVATGWSEDEESSFDADLFFANLDDSSDSCSSPVALHRDLTSDADSDADRTVSFSADESDALLLMDVDPSAHVRRRDGELEFGIALNGLSFGWDGQLFPNLNESFDVDLDIVGVSDIDVDMSTVSGEDSSTEEHPGAGTLLEETDGETTEDELVDANGLPNPRAMMLFRWPATISAINPLSTVSSNLSGHFTPPPDASPSVRIALASFSAHRGSPPPTPADILAGRIYMDDIDELENKSPHTGRYEASSRHSNGAVMGQFVASTINVQEFAVINGSGGDVRTPFPRCRILRAREVLNSAEIQTSDADPPNMRHSTQDIGLSSDSLVHVISSAEDEAVPYSQTQSSDDQSSASAINLDDVLDSDFLNLDTLPFSVERIPEGSVLTPNMQTTGAHLESLNRWDRIPVATFRRTRETVTLDGAGSDGGLNNSYAGVGAMASQAILGHQKSQKQVKNPKRSKGKNSNKLVISPVLLPIRDGDHASSTADPPISSSYQQDGNHKSRKEVRREKASMKRKMVGKYSPRRVHQHHNHHHHHYPNMKSRGSGSMQRTNFFSSSTSSVPHLNL